MLACANRVFETMFFQTVELLNSPASPTGPSHLVTVRFHGQSSGVFDMWIGQRIANELTRDFLPTEEPSSTAVHEVMAELANMLCGHLLTETAADCIFLLGSPVCSYPATGDLPDGTWNAFQLGDQPLYLRITFSD